MKLFFKLLVRDRILVMYTDITDTVRSQFTYAMTFFLELY